MSAPIESWVDQTFPLVEAAKELKAADAAFSKMVEIGIHSFYEYDRAWRDFLHCIDRAWKKVCNEAEGRRNWQQIKSECERLRKTDPLLKYLKHARHISEHTISPIIKEWNPNLKVTPIADKVRLEWEKPNRPLLPFTYRGVLFNPPTEHLGKPMSAYQRNGVFEPRIAAKLAMKFYIEMVNRVSVDVFPGSHT